MRSVTGPARWHRNEFEFARQAAGGAGGTGAAESVRARPLDAPSRLPALPVPARRRPPRRTALRLEAVRAVHRLVAPRLERQPSFAPTLGAGGDEELPSRPRVVARWTTVAAVATAPPLRLACRPARRAATGRVVEPAAGVELLLACRKGECRPAVTTGQDFVRVLHADPHRVLPGLERVSAARCAVGQRPRQFGVEPRSFQRPRVYARLSILLSTHLLGRRSAPGSAPDAEPVDWVTALRRDPGSSRPVAFESPLVLSSSKDAGRYSQAVQPRALRCGLDALSNPAGRYRRSAIPPLTAAPHQPRTPPLLPAPAPPTPPPAAPAPIAGSSAAPAP